MPNDPPPPIRVMFTPDIRRNLKQLAKKYRHIQSDLEPIIKEIEAGNKPGDQVPGVQFDVFKVRVKNSDARKGKSGGYRVIYYVKSDSEIWLVSIFSKSEQADIAADEIRDIIVNFASSAPPESGEKSDETNAEGSSETPTQ